MISIWTPHVVMSCHCMVNLHQDVIYFEYPRFFAIDRSVSL
jgi:hypothetical protein